MSLRDRVGRGRIGRHAGKLLAGCGTVPIALQLLALAPSGAAVAQEDSSDDPTLGRVHIYHSEDPQNPGAGVASVEEVQVPGGTSQQPATQARPAAPVGRPRQCEVYEQTPLRNSIARGLAEATGEEPDIASPLTEADMQPGATYERQCRFADDDSFDRIDDFVFQPAGPAASPVAAAPPSAVVIARQVYAEVPLVLPAPHTSPGIDATQLVGFPIWLWVDGTVWRSFDASASVSGVTVTVVAEPKETTWDMGDGTTVTCAGPGTPWWPNGPDDQRTDCSHFYQFVSDDQPNGRYAASVTVVWSVSWSASTGESGTLPDASRTTEFSLDVAQRQAVITYGR